LRLPSWATFPILPRPESFSRLVTINLRLVEDGTNVTFTVSVTDNGEPGTSDTISISLSTGYLVGGTLTTGDIRIQ
jgi:hypothetical protein